MSTAIHQETTEKDPASTILDNIRGTHDALSVRRVFGDPEVVDGVTMVPVARVAGYAGGGGGEGPGPAGTGRGFGTGFGLRAQPVGAYVVRDGTLQWKPSLDVNRVVRGAQVLIAIVVLCRTLVVLRRNRPAATEG